MDRDNPIWRFILAALAVWRITHLLAEEDGPWDLVARLRSALGAAFLGRLMDCFYCLSLWISLPLAIWLSQGWIGLLLHWQALSGAACLLQKFAGRSQPDFVGIPIPQGETQCAVVKSEAT
jgi:hypothetical protein